MIEDALRYQGVTITDDLASYIAGDWPLIKLHGSVNWAHDVAIRAKWLAGLGKNDVIKTVIEHVQTLTIGSNFRRVHSCPMSARDEGMPLFPAIALPITNKQDFECPPQHVNLLRASLPRVTRLLVVGWRATEKPFLEMLKEHMKPHVRTIAVCGEVRDGEDTLTRLVAADIDVDPRTAFDGGFTKFTTDREIDKFLIN
jgi:hypothetical protein